MEQRIKKTFSIDKKKFDEARSLAIPNGLIISRRVDILLDQIIKELKPEVAKG